jgi:molecular chaperone HtpG
MGHDLVRAVGAAQKAGRDDDVRDLSSLLLDQAHLLDGEIPADPAAFARKLNAFVLRGLRGGA